MAKEADKEFKYGVADIAKALKIEEASARVALRKKNIAKAGKSYGWNSQKELDDVLKKLKSDEKPEAKKEAKKPAADKAAKAKKAA